MSPLQADYGDRESRFVLRDKLSTRELGSMPLGWGLGAAPCKVMGPAGEGRDKAGLHLELKKFFKIFLEQF